MQTSLTEQILATAAGAEADEILRRCVHCGFCNATCPTFGLTGDELEGPRGRIYLIKSVLEGKDASVASLGHLDRCLGCRACETTCPSGVRFHRLADIGREVLHERGTRPAGDLRRRRLLARFFDGSPAFRVMAALGRLLRPVLPARLRRQLPVTGRGPAPEGGGPRAVLLHAGCVQPILTPATDRAAARVLARRGIASRTAPGCCGALAYHLGDVDRARTQIRRNVDAWHAALTGTEGLVVTATGCAAFMRDYGSLCRGDPAYEARAAAVAEGIRDVADFLTPMETGGGPAVALHLPCTLRHALRGAGRLRGLLAASGWRLVDTPDDGQCCGSAGAYSLFYPATGGALRDRKLAQLTAGDAEEIVTANVGCRLHLAGGSAVPVRHWIELWDELEAAGGAKAASPAASPPPAAP